MSLEIEIGFTLNGVARRAKVPVGMSALTMLREVCGLTGTKYGCGAGVCGSCTVVVDGQPVRSCRATLAEVEGRSVTTIEGLAKGGALHPIQQAFVDKGGLQCGFCTPGMIMAGKALLDRNPHPTPDEARAAIAGNLCRCTGYEQIVEAIVAAPAVDEAARVGAREGGHYLMPDMAE